MAQWPTPKFFAATALAQAAVNAFEAPVRSAAVRLADEVRGVDLQVPVASRCAVARESRADCSGNEEKARGSDKTTTWSSS